MTKNTQHMTTEKKLWIAYWIMAVIITIETTVIAYFIASFKNISLYETPRNYQSLDCEVTERVVVDNKLSAERCL